MAIILGNDLIPYVQKLIPSLLEMTYHPLANMGENSKFRSSDHEEADMAIQVINVFLSEYPNQMG